VFLIPGVRIADRLQEKGSRKAEKQGIGLDERHRGRVATEFVVNKFDLLHDAPASTRAPALNSHTHTMLAR
jgi:protein-tyrosine-phosphatase